MSTSPNRRLKRSQDRTAKKMREKISKQTIDQINKQSPEEREALLLLYREILRQKEEIRKDKESK